MKRWTERESRYVADHWRSMSDAQMAVKLKRSECSVTSHRRKVLRMVKEVNKPAPPKETEYFNPHATDCWITGSKHDRRNNVKA